jgi:predicted DNA-binding transcriptional regulator YafY
MAYLNKEYRPCDIDFQNYFDEIVGVTNYENKAVQKLLLRVTKTRIDYLRTKPLHWSQKELKNKETDDHVFLELSLKPNKELEMLLLSYGPDIEVLEPANLRHQLANLVKTMYRKYEV